MLLTKKQRKKSLENKTPSPYREGGNKANIIILYVCITQVSYRLSIDSKTRDLEWYRMAILR